MNQERRGREEPSGGPGPDLIHGGSRAEIAQSGVSLRPRGQPVVSGTLLAGGGGRGREWLAGRLEPPAAAIHSTWSRGSGAQRPPPKGLQPTEPLPVFTLLQKERAVIWIS